MNDDVKKTVRQPRFADRMPYHTVVMDRPPEMRSSCSGKAADVVALEKRNDEPRVVLPLRFRRASPESKKANSQLAATHIPPAYRVPRAPRLEGKNNSLKTSSIGTLRTRMQEVQSMPTFRNQVPIAPPSGDGTRLAPPPPPPSPTSTLGMPISVERSRRNRRILKTMFYGCVAILLGVSLVLPVVETSQDSEAAPTSDAVAPRKPDLEKESEAESVDGARAAMETSTEALPQAQATSASETDVSEKDAGAMLLAGRHSDALALYRELAQSRKTSPGIQAMVEVLTQKVKAQ